MLKFIASVILGAFVALSPNVAQADTSYETRPPGRIYKVPCVEDNLRCWDCTLMGNRVCGWGHGPNYRK